MNEIVQLTTQDVTSAKPQTTSKVIAEKYKVQHSTVARLIAKHIEDFEVFGKVGFKIVPSKRGQSEKVYEITEDQFYLLVTYMKNTDIARKAKIAFVKAFAFARKELQARSETRHIGKAIRHSLTDAINQHMTDGTNSKKFAYSNYTKLVYKRVLGMDVKKAKEARNVPEGKNLRDFLTMPELEAVQALESKIAAFIEISDTEGKDDKAVYAMVKQYIDGGK